MNKPLKVVLIVLAVDIACLVGFAVVMWLLKDFDTGV
jgi:hypothetical protein